MPARPQTPAVLIDLDTVERNIRQFQTYAIAHAIAVRPHIKTHKLPTLAEWQLAAGAVGLTCQKISEARAMVDASPVIADILITYNIVGTEKLADLLALAQRVKLSVTADSKAVVDGLARTFAGVAPLRVLVECDTGAHRCGVATPADACALALDIAASPSLTFGGFATYPPVGGVQAVEVFMSEAKRKAEAAGLAVPVISSGGSPDAKSAHLAPCVTEYRPGTYIYNDRSLVEHGACGWDDCALVVETTVVSVPEPTRAIIDAGSKVLTTDPFGLSGFGHVLDHPDITIDQLSEEHGRLRGAGVGRLTVGDRLRIVPNHACVVTNMMDEVWVTRRGQIEGCWPVAARGKVV